MHVSIMIILLPKRKFEVPVQAACISPDVLRGKDISEIANIPITEGNHNLKRGDPIEIQEDKLETPFITINGDVSKVKRIGSAMKTGEILVNGDVGCLLYTSPSPR